MRTHKKANTLKAESGWDTPLRNPSLSVQDSLPGCTVICLDWWRKGTRNIPQETCFRTEIWKRKLPDTKQECQDDLQLGYQHERQPRTKATLYHAVQMSRPISIYIYLIQHPWHQRLIDVMTASTSVTGSCSPWGTRCYAQITIANAIQSCEISVRYVAAKETVDCWLEVSTRKVPRPAISAQGFLGFPMPISKCWDGSQDSKLPLHASHVALPTY